MTARAARPVSQVTAVNAVLGDFLEGRLSRRRFIARAAALGLSVPTIGLLGSNAARAQTASTTAAIVDLWAWLGGSKYEEVLDAAAQRFAGDSLGNQLVSEYIAFENYLPRVRTSLAGGVPPSLVQMPWAGDFVDIVDSGALTALTGALGDGFPEFFAPILASVTHEADVWAIPLDVNNLAIAYNVDLFDELGLHIPTSHDELIALIEPITRAGYLPMAISVRDGWPLGDLWFAQMAYAAESDDVIRQAERGSLPWDDPRMLAAVRRVDELRQAGLFAQDSSTLVTNELASLFAAKQAAMFYPVGNFNAPAIQSAAAGQMTFDLFRFPPPDAGTEVTGTGGIAVMFSVPRDAPNADAALDVLRLLTDETGREELVKRNFIPSSPSDTSGNADPLYATMTTFQATARTRALFVPEVYAALVNGMQGLFGGSNTPEDVVGAMVAAAVPA